MNDASTNLASDFLNFMTTFIPYSVIFGIFWKVVDAILKYASESRDARTRELIDEATKPLEKDIKDLTKSIWALSEKIEKM
jgi:hypothetical protein